jgi:hypothetical protein
MSTNENKSGKQSNNEENDTVTIPLLLRGRSESQVPEAQHTVNLFGTKVSNEEFKKIIHTSIEMDKYYLKQFRERNRF